VVAIAPEAGPSVRLPEQDQKIYISSLSFLDVDTQSAALSGEANLPDILQKLPKSRLRGMAHGSIQEGHGNSR
jgi:hypothetical protein